MELIIAAALIAVIVAWWFARSKARRDKTAAQRPTPDYKPIPPALQPDLPAENASPSEPASPSQADLVRPYAEIADPGGGVRDISAEEVSAYFEPVRKKLASLRKVAANSARTAQAFSQNGGATPDVGVYSRAHKDALSLITETESLLDIILFDADSSSTKYYDLLESAVDVEAELEENLADLADIAAEIASGNFLANEPVRAARQKAQQARA